LVIADMNVDGGQQTVHTITENGSEATFIQVDRKRTGIKSSVLTSPACGCV
jgi:hypothetical protein